MERKSAVGFEDEAAAIASSIHSVDSDAIISKTQKPSMSTGMSFRSKVLRSNLTRTQKNRDPLFYYEVQKVLGVGSMGSVVKARRFLLQLCSCQFS